MQAQATIPRDFNKMHQIGQQPSGGDAHQTADATAVSAPIYPQDPPPSVHHTVAPSTDNTAQKERNSRSRDRQSYIGAHADGHSGSTQSSAELTGHRRSLRPFRSSCKPSRRKMTCNRSHHCCWITSRREHRPSLGRRPPSTQGTLQPQLRTYFLLPIANAIHPTTAQVQCSIAVKLASIQCL